MLRWSIRTFRPSIAKAVDAMPEMTLPASESANLVFLRQQVDGSLYVKPHGESAICCGDINVDGKVLGRCRIGQHFDGTSFMISKRLRSYLKVHIVSP